MWEHLKEYGTWKNFCDISIVTVIVHQILTAVKGTRAEQTVIGFIIIFCFYVVAVFFELHTTVWIMDKFYSGSIVLIIVLFQDDIRRVISSLGRRSLLNEGTYSEISVIEEVISAIKMLQRNRTGALIVFERRTPLDKLHDHGILISALVSDKILSSIFNTFSPLHDGAVIIKKNKIEFASAQVPLSKNSALTRNLGTRHNAAVGISEETDAVALVVSETTSNISVAFEGNMYRKISIEHAKDLLLSLLSGKTKNHVKT